jgi:hypothetical protein
MVQLGLGGSCCIPAQSMIMVSVATEKISPPLTVGNLRSALGSLRYISGSHLSIELQLLSPHLSFISPGLDVSIHSFVLPFISVQSLWLSFKFPHQYAIHIFCHLGYNKRSLRSSHQLRPPGLLRHRGSVPHAPLDAQSLRATVFIACVSALAPSGTKHKYPLLSIQVHSGI